MKTLQTLLLTLSISLFSGCGVSHHDDINFAYVDNKELTPYSNQYGYFGEDVIFGEEHITGEWVLYDVESSDTIYSYFYNDGVLETDNGSRQLYGVSWDGLSIDISTGERIEIITSTIYRYEEGLPCYRVELSEGYSYQTADMCPI